MLLPKTAQTDLRKKIIDLSIKYNSSEKVPPKLRKEVSDALLLLHPYSIDTKQDMQEVYNNIISDHKRFKNECVLGNENLCILVEENTICTIEDVSEWINTRSVTYYINKSLGLTVPKMPPVSSKQAQCIMNTMSLKYGIEWQFCKPQTSGKKIIELLKCKAKPLANMV